MHPREAVTPVPAPLPDPPARPVSGTIDAAPVVPDAAFAACVARARAAPILAQVPTDEIERRCRRPFVFEGMSVLMFEGMEVLAIGHLAEHADELQGCEHLRPAGTTVSLDASDQFAVDRAIGAWLAWATSGPLVWAEAPTGAAWGDWAAATGEVHLVGTVVPPAAPCEVHAIVQTRIEPGQ
jgi:hypothetical protein